MRHLVQSVGGHRRAHQVHAALDADGRYAPQTLGILQHTGAPRLPIGKHAAV